MKKIILLFAAVCLAGCGKNSNPSAYEQSPNSGYTNSSNAAGNGMDTNSPAATNQNSGR